MEETMRKGKERTEDLFAMSEEVRRVKLKREYRRIRLERWLHWFISGVALSVIISAIPRLL